MQVVASGFYHEYWSVDQWVLAQCKRRSKNLSSKPELMEAVFHLGRQLRRASIVSRVMDQQGFLATIWPVGERGAELACVSNKATT